MRIRRRGYFVLAIAMLVIGLVMFLWQGGRQRSSPAVTTPPAAVAEQAQAATESFSVTKTRDSSRRKAAILKDLGNRLRQQEAQRVVQVSDAEFDFLISDRFRTAYHLPAEQTSARMVAKYAVLRAPSDAERAAMEDLMSAALAAPEFFSASETSEIRAGLEKSYLDYPKAFKLLTSSHHTYLRDPRYTTISVRNVDEYRASDGVTGQKLEGPPEIFHLDGTDDPADATRDGPETRTKYGYLLGFQE